MPALTALTPWRLSAALLERRQPMRARLRVRIDAIIALPRSRRLVALVVTIVMVCCSTGPTAVLASPGIGAGRQDLSHHGPQCHRAWAALVPPVARGRPTAARAPSPRTHRWTRRDRGWQVGRSRDQRRRYASRAACRRHYCDHGPRRALVDRSRHGKHRRLALAWSWYGTRGRRELEPAVAQVARLCAPVNRDVMSNPPRPCDRWRRPRRAPEHTRALRTSALELSNLYRAGVASLYTVEFYRAARARLAPGGIFVQWVQAYVRPTFRRYAWCTRRCSVFSVESWSTRGGSRAGRIRSALRRARCATWHNEQPRGRRAAIHRRF